MDSPLYHEPSLSADVGKIEDDAIGPAEAEASSSGGWARGYLDPFGVLGKVFGRRNSAPPQPEAPARSKAVQALDFGSDAPAL